MPSTMEDVRSAIARERELLSQCKSSYGRVLCKEKIALLEKALIDAAFREVESENVTG